MRMFYRSFYASRRTTEGRFDSNIRNYKTNAKGAGAVGAAGAGCSGLLLAGESS